MNGAKTVGTPVEILELGDKDLVRLSQDHLWALSRDEMIAVQEYFRTEGRPPSRLEMEVIAQTWSEHCKHKVFSSMIEYQEQGKDSELIDGIFHQYIAQATRTVRQAKGSDDYCVSVFLDNAGVISYDKDCCVAFKVETHNHPSALEPYGGAGTGIGGVIRDVLGTGLGARPCFNTDIFCFAPPDWPYDKLPEGVLHPRRILRGVVSGVRDYGNRMGIPTVSGGIQFDEKFLGNPLVYCGTAGVIPTKRMKKGCRAGDMLVAIGGRTGRDGLHGATFSSLDLHKDTPTSTVQIGNPIVEKKVTEALVRARDEGLLRDVTDCGAGGFSSAIGEMAKEHGAVVFLEKAPLKYSPLEDWEIFLSESQERMVAAIAPEHFNQLKKICQIEEVEVVSLGQVTNSHRLVVWHDGQVVGDLAMSFLHKGVPRQKRKAIWQPKQLPQCEVVSEGNVTSVLLQALHSWNVCSRETIIRQYDHEVRGGAVLKPLVGTCADGPGDASVVKAVLDKPGAIAIAHGINVRYGQIDPYWMAGSVIEEAIRGLVSVGGNPDRVAILDNFCWGNPDRPELLGDLVRAAKACHDFAVAFGAPFISGKDSFYNQYQTDSGPISIPPTLLISAMTVLPSEECVVSMDIKGTKNHIYLLGNTRVELGGSIYAEIQGRLGCDVPKVLPEESLPLMRVLHRAIEQNLVRSCHDLSEGGLAVAAAEMALAGRIGMSLDLRSMPEHSSIEQDAALLFSESNGRFLVEVSHSQQQKFERLMSGLPCALLGETVEDASLKVVGRTGEVAIEVALDDIERSWKRSLWTS